MPCASLILPTPPAHERLFREVLAGALRKGHRIVAECLEHSISRRGACLRQVAIVAGKPVAPRRGRPRTRRAPSLATAPRDRHHGIGATVTIGIGVALADIGAAVATGMGVAVAMGVGARG